MRELRNGEASEGGPQRRDLQYLVEKELSVPRGEECKAVRACRSGSQGEIPTPIEGGKERCEIQRKDGRLSSSRKRCENLGRR